MAKTMAAFYELPPWYEKMNRLQQQIDSLTRPLLGLQTDYAALTKTISSVLDSPAMRNINKISSTFDSQTMAAMYRTQEIVSKIDMPRWDCKFSLENESKNGHASYPIVFHIKSNL